jgi:hypothetical protein
MDDIDLFAALLVLTIVTVLYLTMPDFSSGLWLP